jgi:hypothetical protein
MASFQSANSCNHINRPLRFGAFALQRGKPDISALVGIYAKIARMRVQFSSKVVESAERIGRKTELLSPWSAGCH